MLRHAHIHSGQLRVAARPQEPRVKTTNPEKGSTPCFDMHTSTRVRLGAPAHSPELRTTTANSRNGQHSVLRQAHIHMGAALSYSALLRTPNRNSKFQTWAAFRALTCTHPVPTPFGQGVSACLVCTQTLCTQRQKALSTEVSHSQLNLCG